MKIEPQEEGIDPMKIVLLLRIISSYKHWLYEKIFWPGRQISFDRSQIVRKTFLWFKVDRKILSLTGQEIHCTIKKVFCRAF